MSTTEERLQAVISKIEEMQSENHEMSDVIDIVSGEVSIDDED